MSKLLSLTPRMSEKAYGLSNERSTYVFSVPLSASKQQIARAVADQFEVSVVSVNTLKQKGKSLRTISTKGRRVAKGRQTQAKKAYVKLASGQSIPIFAATEEQEKKAADTQAAAAKALDKQTAADAKPSHFSRKRKAED